jgi:hypothetical protein
MAFQALWPVGTPAVRSAAAAVIAAAALVGGSRPSVAQPPQGGPGFLFRAPVGSLTLRGGLSAPLAGSEVFDFATRELTLERTDFWAPSVGAELAIRLAPRVDVLGSVAYARSESRSEFRDYIGSDDLPIEQDTRFGRVPLALGLRAYLGPRGRQIGRFAWVPATWAPYVGAGGGWIWYRFEQDGEFVDFEDLSIFRDRFRSDGWASSAYAAAGADLSLSPRFALNGELRYNTGRALMSSQFSGFDRIDLSGFQFTAGLGVRF